MKKQPYIAAIWIAVAFVMVFAAGTTVADWKGAEYKMNNQWLPARWSPIAVVWANLGLQLLVAVGLLCAVFSETMHRWAWILASVLMLGYTLYTLIAYMDWAPRKLCACIALIDGMTWGQALTFNTILFMLLITGGAATYNEKGGKA